MPPAVQASVTDCPAVLIDGKATAARVKAEVATGIRALRERSACVPGLAVVLVGDDPASASYVRMKEKDCAEVGIRTFDHRLPDATSQEELHTLLDELNRSECVHGVLLQLPLPGHLDENLALARIAPAKDVDGLGTENLGRMLRGQAGLRPCTPAGVIRLLDDYEIATAGRRAVVVGRSVIVGKSLAVLLLARDATVTICHSQTVDLPRICREADILVAAIGVPGFFDASYVKPGAVVIDVGINRSAGGGLCGDVDFAGVSAVVGAITPVPGGVGPMTRALLMSNTLDATEAACS
jgi:methylenetetrahydrofolate dehydrogenase (NADP+)/methenyltetrahydrofolate cyclohydrolase